jgi:uncharacterized protein involved in outer membrane biogenesis
MAEEASAPKKKSWMKRIVWTLVIVFVLLAGATVAAPFFIPWNEVKDQAADFLTKKLHHKVEIGSVEVHLFSGISLKDVKVGNASGFSAQPLFDNAEARVHYNLWLSLAARKLILSKVEFISPHVLIEKKGNTFNFSDMSSAPSKSAPSSSSGAETKSESLPLSVGALAVSKGDFVYRDHNSGKTTSIGNLDLMLTGFSLAEAGKSRLKVHFVAETEGKQIPVDLDSTFRLDLAGDSLDLSRADLKLPDVTIGASGNVAHLTGKPEGDLKVDGHVALDNLVADLVPPSYLKKLPAGLKASGSLNLNANLKGLLTTPEKLAWDGKLALESVGLAYGSYPALEHMTGELSVSPTRASLPSLDLTLGGQPVKFSLDASGLDMANLSGPASNLQGKVKFSLTSPKLVLDPLLKLAGTSEGPELSPAEEAKEEAREAALPEPPPMQIQKLIPAGLAVDGKVDFGSIQAKGVSTGRFTQTIVVARRQARLETALAAFGGNFTNQVNANLGVPGSTYGFAAKLDGFKMEQLLDMYAAVKPKTAWLQEAHGHVFGTLGLSIRGTGAGLNGKAIKRQLNATGFFKLADGKFTHLPVLQRIASAIPYPPAQEVLSKDVSFDRCQTSFSMKGGKAVWPDFVLDSGSTGKELGRTGDLAVQSAGTLIPSGPVQIAVTPHFNPRVVQLQGDLAQYFQDDKGWATYDSILYSGPTMTTAHADFTQGAKNAAKKAISKQVDAVKQKAQEAIKSKAQDLLKQLPGNLFGQ